MKFEVGFRTFSVEMLLFFFNAFAAPLPPLVSPTGYVLDPPSLNGGVSVLSDATASFASALRAMVAACENMLRCFPTDLRARSHLRHSADAPGG